MKIGQSRQRISKDERLDIYLASFSSLKDASRYIGISPKTMNRIFRNENLSKRTKQLLDKAFDRRKVPKVRYLEPNPNNVDFKKIIRTNDKRDYKIVVKYEVKEGKQRLLFYESFVSFVDDEIRNYDILQRQLKALIENIKKKYKAKILAFYIEPRKK